jgi:hypothetical protein
MSEFVVSGFGDDEMSGRQRSELALFAEAAPGC